jgi:hypothetical protein
MTCDIQLREMVQELLLQVKLYTVCKQIAVGKGNVGGHGSGFRRLAVSGGAEHHNLRKASDGILCV